MEDYAGKKTSLSLTRMNIMMVCSRFALLAVIQRITGVTKASFYHSLTFRPYYAAL